MLNKQDALGGRGPLHFRLRDYMTMLNKNDRPTIIMFMKAPLVPVAADIVSSSPLLVAASSV